MFRPRVLAAPAAVVLALALAPRARAGDRPWTSDDILSLRTVSAPQVSPDGKTVAYVVSEMTTDGLDYQTDLWTVPTAGGPGEARRLTSSLANDEAPRWLPDSRTVVFLSERPRPRKAGGDASDDAKKQLWTIRVDGGEASPLSDAPGSVSEFSVSADGRTIAFLARDAKSDERKKREKDKDDATTPQESWAWSRLWSLDVATRKAVQLTKGDLHVAGAGVSPDGRTIVYAAQPTPEIPSNFRTDLFLVPAAGGDPKPLVTRKGLDADPVFSPDGKWIAFVSQDGRDDDWYTDTYLCVVPVGGGEARNLSAGTERIAGSPIWAPDSSAVYFGTAWKTAAHLWRAALGGKAARLTDGDALVTSASLDAKGTTLACLRQSSLEAPEVEVRTLPGTAWKRLTDTNPEARERLAFRKEVVTWKGPGGLDVEGLLLLPPSRKANEKVPLVLNVHGGPAGVHANTWTPGGSRLYPWPLFLQKGWAILLPNPRGSGAYGGAFRAANVKDWAGKDYDDVMAGVDAMIAKGVADPARLAVCGWSYGGFMTSNVVTKTDRFKAAVVGAGVTSMVSFTGTADIPEFARSYFGGWPWEVPENYARASAVLGAGRVKTPTLVIHGEKDDRVPTSQGWEFWNALRKTGVPTDLILLPRTPHGPREPKLLKTCHKAHLDWFEKYVPGAPK